MMIQVPCSTVLFRQGDPGSEMIVACWKIAGPAYSWQSRFLWCSMEFPLKFIIRFERNMEGSLQPSKTWIQRCGNSSRGSHLPSYGPLQLPVPETNIAPEHWWLEDYSPFYGKAEFQELLLVEEILHHLLFMKPL